MVQNKGEPSLNKISDYKGKESKEKKRIVRLVIAFLIIFSFVLFFLRQDPSKTQDKMLINPLEEIREIKNSD